MCVDVVKSSGEGGDALAQYLEEGLEAVLHLGGAVAKLSGGALVEETVERAHECVHAAVDQIDRRATEATHAWSQWKVLDDASRVQLARTTASSTHDNVEAPPVPATATTDGFVHVLRCGLGACVTRRGEKFKFGLATRFDSNCPS